MRQVSRLLDFCERIAAPLDRFASLISMMGLFGLMGLAALVSMDVVMRSVFNSPIQGVDDIGHLILASVIAACWPAGIVRRHNIAIRFLGNAIGRRGSAILDTLGAVGLLAFFSLIAWQLVAYTRELAATNAHTWVLGWSKAPWWTLTAILVGLCVPIQALATAENLLRAMTGRYAAEMAPPPLDRDDDDLVGTGRNA